MTFVLACIGYVASIIAATMAIHFALDRARRWWAARTLRRVMAERARQAAVVGTAWNAGSDADDDTPTLTLAGGNVWSVVSGSLYGATPEPPLIPDDAQSGRWEAFHLFSPYARRPSRHSWGVDCPEPPLAMVCPECDLKQAPLHYGERRCRYCGVLVRVHGSRLYWWRAVGAPAVEWRP